MQNMFHSYNDTPIEIEKEKKQIVNCEKKLVVE